jgi:ribonuclease P protein component
VTAARSQAFLKASRLRRRHEFLKVQERGVKLSADSLTAMVVAGCACTRIGFTVSSKVGNSVVRNRVRRRLRELTRRVLTEWPAGLEIVFIARPSAADAPFEALARAVNRITSELQRRFA